MYLTAFFYVLLIFWSRTYGQKKYKVKIGGIFRNNSSIKLLQKQVEFINAYKDNEESTYSNQIEFSSSSTVMPENPIRASMLTCDEVIPEGVNVVIISHTPESSLSAVSVSFTCVYYRIPVISISSRDMQFSDKTLHGSFLRTVPAHSQQGDVWVSLVRNFKWKQVIFFHSDDPEGRAILSRFQNKAEVEKMSPIHVDHRFAIKDDDNNYNHILADALESKVRINLVYGTKEECERLFNEAIKLNMLTNEFVWIVTEQCLEAPNVPQGVLGTELVDANDERKHIADAVTVIAQAFDNMIKRGYNWSKPLTECQNEHWNSGSKVYKFLRNVVLENGATGRVQFTAVGDRVYQKYDIVNIGVNGSRKVIGSYRATKLLDDEDDNLVIFNETILWPGASTHQPDGIKRSRHLNVTTVKAIPFVYVVPGTDCPITATTVQKEGQERKIRCPKLNITTGKIDQYCCYGYCIDLLINLANEVNFTYSLHLNPENKYGDLQYVNDSEGEPTREWNGMMGELTCDPRHDHCINGHADMIIAPLTITPERATDIDFSKPFKYQGYTILVKKWKKKSSFASFMQPFQNKLWLLVGMSVHLIALVLYLLDRFSPFGRFKLARSDDTEEDALNLSTAIWFAWGVLLNSGIGEGTPRSFSGRVLGMVWAGFAMIIVASYTANLAAFLVLDRPEMSALSGIDDAKLRNPDPNKPFRYATVKDTGASQYFRRQVEMSTMYNAMEPFNKDTPEEAIQALVDDELQAFIWDSAILEYTAATNCELTTAGDLFGRSGYGIGLSKGSDWTHDISIKILGFHEQGNMEDMDKQWILQGGNKCPQKDPSPTTLGLLNMAGVFVMVAGGIVAGIFLIFVEIAYKRHRGMKEKEMELARNAADKWRQTIQRRKQQRMQEQQDTTMSGVEIEGKLPYEATPDFNDTKGSKTAALPQTTPAASSNSGRLPNVSPAHSSRPRLRRPGGYEAVPTTHMQQKVAEAKQSSMV